jgi:flagellar L-ring protein precursor FlgH
LASRTDIGFDVSSNGTFAGESGSSQSNSLSGSITVTVTEVLPGGNLRVQGEKWVEINQGKEFVRLGGVVRPRDVKPNNTILSTQVADARITYSGKGAGADSNVIGWAARLLFSALKPF